MINFNIPRHWLWLGALALPVLSAAVGFIYYPALLKSGVLPTEADSIGIPMFSAVLFSPLFAGLLVAFAWPAFHKYDGSAMFVSTNAVQPWRMAIGLIIYGLPAAAVASEPVQFLLSSKIPAIEHWWLLVDIPAIFWLLILRAAFTVNRAQPDEM